MHTFRKRRFSVIGKLGIIGLFSSFAAAAVTTIWAVYLDSFIQNAAYVGFIISFFTIIGICAYIFLIPLVEKSSKSKLYSAVILIYIISYVLFALFPYIYVIIILGTIIAVITSLEVTLFGIIVRDKTKRNHISENEGIVYTLLNLSWLIAPVLAGFVSNKYGMRSVFILGSVIFFSAFIFFKLFKIKDSRRTKKIDRNPLKPLISFFKKKERIYTYFLGGGISFWWALIYIYMPIYIFESGFGEEFIGYFLGAVTIPLIFTEYYFAKLAGKKGFKKIFIIGYFILAISALSVFFISNIYLILLILAMASFGAGMLEPTTEAHFFDIVNKNQRDKFYGPYNTAIDLNAFLGTSLSAVILLFLPFKFIFLLFSVAMFALVLTSSRIKNVIESRRTGKQNS